MKNLSEKHQLKQMNILMHLCFDLENDYLHIKKITFYFLMFWMFSACSSSGAMEENVTPNKSSETEVSSFIFEAKNNSNLNSNIAAEINLQLKEIKLKVLEGTDVSNLVPTISVSKKAVIEPMSGQAQNYTQPKIYTVTAEDGSTIKYTVSVEIIKQQIPSGTLNVGDPGVTVNTSAFDANYPQMSRWAKAGVEGGIPFIDSFNKTSAINAGNSAAINAAIDAMSSSLGSGEMGLITLNNGTYTIDAAVKMKSNVSLIGESRDGVVCSISMNGGAAFSFVNVKYCGLYNLTIRGSWPEPKYDWNYGISQNREFTNDNISVRLKSGTKNCWLDKVNIFNSARDPLRVPAAHNTFRDLIVDGCKRKAGGAEGYFFIQGRDNLITGCQITRLRHISLQGDDVEYNVVYNNDFRQEVSFHSGDSGNNLIENNKITLPADMPPIENGETGPFPETESGKPIYFAIMGPWSDRHRNSANPNFIYRNTCLQLNHAYGSSTPWSDDSVVYFGPKKKGLSIQERIDNFPKYDKGAPSGGTLYAIKL